VRQYLLRRLLAAIPVLFAVSIIIFSLVRLIPGDAVMLMLAEVGRVPKDELNQVRAELGLDQPFLQQYVSWITNVLHGDLGRSLSSRKPVGDLLWTSLPITLELAVMAMALAVILAIPLGILSAIRQDRWPDYAARLFSIGFLSIPDFWLGTLAIVFLAVWVRWIPPTSYVSFMHDPGANLQQLLLPAIILGVRFSASSTRMIRSAMLEVLRDDYMRTAWAKGLGEGTVVVRHGLKNAFIPVVTIMGTQFSYLLGGSVVVETIFSLPGLGRLLFNAITLRDYPLVQGAVLFIGVVMIVMNLLIDLSYAWFDPRVRFSR
jgi:peptide/nickel transport system permease protein